MVIIFGTILYGLLRLIGRRSISAMLQPLVKKVDLTLVDEIGYRSVLIGFPVFTLGALIFAMMWAQDCMGPLLGLGSKRSLGFNYMVILCSIPTLTFIKRLGR